MVFILMKTLYESILGSTKTGIIKTIEKWAESHIFSANPQKYLSWKINNDGKIVENDNNNIILGNKDDVVPEFVKFGDISTCFFIDNIDNIKDNQIGVTKNLYILGDKANLSKRKFDVGKICAIKSPIVTLKDTTVNFSISNSNSKLDFTSTNFELPWIKELNTNVWRICLDKTPAEKELLKAIRKANKYETYQAEFSKKINDLFSHLTNVGCIEIKNHTFYHDKTNNFWYYQHFVL